MAMQEVAPEVELQKVGVAPVAQFAGLGVFSGVP